MELGWGETETSQLLAFVLFQVKTPSQMDVAPRMVLQVELGIDGIE